MKTIAKRLQLPLFFSLSLSMFLTAGAPVARAAGQASANSHPARISAEISGNQKSVLPGSKRPGAQAQFDTGRLPATSRLQGISLYFSRSESQERDLKALIAAQQNPSSPLYHQWLTPDQFASRYGMADSDISKVEGWLEQQGFSIDAVNRSRNVIRFSGTAGQVESAFATEMHTYAVKTATGIENHFAPSTDLSVPSALAGVVLGVRNLDDFRPHSHFHLNRNSLLKPAFTSSQTGNVYFAPGDIATVYDIQKEYNAGYTGIGQTITIVGQSAIATSDLDAFWSAAGITRQDPEITFVPGTGTSTVQADGDETESDLDLEWSGAIAKGATLNFVYVGNSSTASAFDSIQYAVENKIGTIISSSYGDCETDLGGQTLESTFEQAASQGQTVMSAAGDDGSTDCFPDTNLTTAQREALAVDYPASSPNVTGVGGTEISQANSAYLTAGSAYWEAEGSTDEITSALQYIPEQAWNEDAAGCGEMDCLSSGGGGASALFSKPSWQTGVTGIPSDGQRDVPDISLNSSTGFPGYLYCTSDQSSWVTGQAASCNSGFRDSSSGALTVAGGTSFAAPIFSGMLALINQQQEYTTGQGLINPTLYTLAADSTTYAAAFHDITSGDNDCRAGSSFCSGTIGFSAGTGYDQATGLGTIDLFNLASAWPLNTGSTATLIDTTTTIAASNTSPTINTADNFTISVTSATGTTIPTGTVNITVDGGTPVTETLTANGTYVYTATFTTTGAHTILAAYSGDATHTSSTGSTTVTVAGTTSGTGSFALSSSPSTLTVSQGSSGSESITVTPAGGYTGTVYLTFDTSNDTALQNICYQFTNTLSNGDGSVSVTDATAVSTQLSLDTNAADCATNAAVRKTGKQSFRSLHGVKTSSNSPSSGGIKTAPASIAFAGLLLAGFLGRYSRKFRSLAGVIALVAIGLGVSACGGGGSSGPSDPSKGTYTITVTGQDSSSATIPTATSTFTFTIQ